MQCSKSIPIVVALGIPLAFLGVTGAFAEPPSHSEYVLKAGVIEELARSPSGDVYVVVRLRENVIPRGVGLRQKQEAVRAVQERVLRRLEPDEFEPVYQYANIAALTGRVSMNGLAKLAAHPDVAQVGLDQPGHAHLASSVPFINGNDVHDLSFTGEGLTVAVLDTGMDPNHPDLSDNIAPGAYHYLNQGGDVGAGAWNYGTNAHGTNVAGIITSKGDVASKGVAPDADILAIQVLDANGNGWVSDWAAGVARPI